MIRSVHHDPTIRAAAQTADPSNRGIVARMSRWFGRGADREPQQDLVDEAAPDPVWPVAPAASSPDSNAASLEATAALLAELIATAEARIDGAVLVVGRSAEEARAYGRALAHEAAALESSPENQDMAAALVAITRSMIAHTRGAEERLRSMSSELERLQADLADARTCAERDQLTGLPNRRALEAALTRAVVAADAANHALSVAFCDIDHFKRLNDTHGHALGDRVLRLVADCLSDGAGEDVFVGRQGGEEFVMLFDGIGLDDAMARVDAIRADLAAREFKSRTNKTPVGRITFSAGVAALRDGETGESMLHRADSALYRAKANGRNRVEADRDAG